jgi:hypothetical protein
MNATIRLYKNGLQTMLRCLRILLSVENHVKYEAVASACYTNSLLLLSELNNIFLALCQGFVGGISRPVKVMGTTRIHQPWR